MKHTITITVEGYPNADPRRVLTRAQRIVNRVGNLLRVADPVFKDVTIEFDGAVMTERHWGPWHD